MKLEDINNIEKLQSMVESLWRLLDHIDTVDQDSKNDNALFRIGARKHMWERFDILEFNGNDLFLPGTLE